MVAVIYNIQQALSEIKIELAIFPDLLIEQGKAIGGKQQ